MSDNTTPAATPAGWYPHPGGIPGIEMYWDGQHWVQTQTRPTAAVSATTQAQTGPVAVAAPARRKLPLWAWIGIGVVALIVVISSIANAGNRSDDAAPNVDPQLIAEEPSLTEPSEEPTPEPVVITMPDVVGTPLGDAIAELEALGLTVNMVTPGAQDDWTVKGQNPQPGTTLGEGDEVRVSGLAPLTLAQQQAIQSGQSYLDNLGGFSKKRLIEQLEYEGFPTKDATFAAEHVSVNWKEQAAESAESYMENVGGFSRDRLAEQLAYEGFTPEQIAYALKAVGY